MRTFRRKGSDKPSVAVAGTTDADIDLLVDAAKKHVKGIFIPKNEDARLLEVTDWIPMPAPFQEIMGTLGLPCGQIIEAYGRKDSGKTSFAVEALASVQREGGLAILIDTENKFSLRRAAAMGLNVKRLMIIPATTIEEAFDKFVAMINTIKSLQSYTVRSTFKDGARTFEAGLGISGDIYAGLTAKRKKLIEVQNKFAGKKICCVWDSLGATPSDAEMDPGIKDFSMTAAKVVKGRLRRVVRYIKDAKVAFVIINQVYANMNQFGKKTTPYGGSGPEYHCCMILEFVSLHRIRPPGFKAGTPFCGINAQVEVVKNHLSQPFKQTEIQIDWRGFVIDRDAEYMPKEFENAEKPDRRLPGHKEAGIVDSPGP